MPWTISTRLTVTFVALTGAILSIVCCLSFWGIKASVEKDAMEAAKQLADRVARSIMRQLDEELLVEFNGETISFGNLNVEAKYWAVVRGGHHIEFASDPLLMARSDGSPLTDHMLSREPLDEFWVASVPLLQMTGPKVAHLPPSVLKTLTAAAPGAAFLTAKREMSGSQNVISSKMLYNDFIVEFKVSEGGDLVEKENEELAASLPPGFLNALPVDQRVQRIDRLSWAAYDGQLIAIIDGRLSDSSRARVAMNRLGEVFHVNELGAIKGKIDASTLHIIAASDRTRDRDKMVTASALIAAGGVGAWLAVSFAGWHVTKKALFPVDGIVSTVDQIQLSHLEQRLPIGETEDELSRLSSTINTMLDRIEAGYNREQQFVSDAAHELTGPLCKVIADIEVALSRQRHPAEYRDVLQRVWGYAGELHRLVESLLLLARLDSKRESLHFEAIDIVDLISDLVSTLRQEDGERVMVRVDDADEAVMLGVPELIKSMFRNLIDNALRYSPPADSVQVRIRLKDEQTQVEIVDRGPGIRDEEALRIFDRFYRLDDTRTRETGGFGLGLAIVRAIADIHDAEVQFRTDVTVGAIVCVKFCTVHRISM